MSGAACGDDLEALSDVLGCRFTEWNECLVHWTEATPQGYDEPTCATASAILASCWLRAECAEGAREGWAAGHRAGYTDRQGYELGDGCGPDAWDCTCENPFARAAAHATQEHT